jgi:hypothetical protein
MLGGEAARGVPRGTGAVGEMFPRHCGLSVASPPLSGRSAGLLASAFARLTRQLATAVANVPANGLPT